jgi:hypothetical protein
MRKNFIQLNNSPMTLVQIIKRFYQIYKNSNILCFYDEQTFYVFCHSKQRSSLSYKYYFQYDKCQFFKKNN